MMPVLSSVRTSPSLTKSPALSTAWSKFAVFGQPVEKDDLSFHRHLFRFDWRDWMKIAFLSDGSEGIGYTSGNENQWQRQWRQFFQTEWSGNRNAGQNQVRLIWLLKVWNFRPGNPRAKCFCISPALKEKWMLLKCENIFWIITLSKWKSKHFKSRSLGLQVICPKFMRERCSTFVFWKKKYRSFSTNFDFIFLLKMVTLWH